MKYILLIALFTVNGFSATLHENRTYGGRFQLIQLGEMARDQYLLDTNTGKIWQSVCGIKNSDNPMLCDFMFFSRIEVDDITIPAKDIQKMIKYIKDHH